jgi:tetratricopeptide (TPR) repeat protein
MYKQVLKGYEKALRPEHKALNTVNNLGVLYWKQGELGKAEEMYEQALKGYEKTLGPEHTSTLETISRENWIIYRFISRGRPRLHPHRPRRPQQQPPLGPHDSNKNGREFSSLPNGKDSRTALRRRESFYKE